MPEQSDQAMPPLVGPPKDEIEQPPAQPTSESTPAGMPALVGPPGQPQGGAPPESSGWGVPLQAALAGATRGITELGQSAETASGQQPQYQMPTWFEQPYEVQDLHHIYGRLLPKFLYQMSNSFPELGAGTAGAAVGAGVGSAFPAVGTVIGGLAGGALAAGGMSYAHKIGPYYARELQNSPQDPEGAWSRAQKAAALSGALSSASWGLFGAQFTNPFESAAKNLLFQTVAVQPGVAASGQLAQNYMTGQPLTSHLLEAAGQGAVATAIPAAGFAAAHGLRSLAQASHLVGTPGSGMEAPTRGEMEGDAGMWYGTSKASGPVPDMAGLNVKKTALHQSLVQDGADPRYQPDVFKIIDNLDVGRQGHVDMNDLTNATQELGNLSWEKRGTTTGYRALQAKNGLDAVLTNQQELQGLGYNPDQAALAAQANSTATQLWHNAKVMEHFETIADRVSLKPEAEQGKAWQTAFRNVLGSKQKDSFPPEIQAAMKEVATHGSDGFTNMLKLPQSIPGGMIMYYLSELAGSHLGILAALGGQAQKLARRGAMAKIAQQAEAIGPQIGWQAGPTLGRSQPAPIVAPRTAPPWVRPPAIVRQLQPDNSGEAHGGSVNRAVALARTTAGKGARSAKR